MKQSMIIALAAVLLGCQPPPSGRQVCARLADLSSTPRRRQFRAPPRTSRVTSSPAAQSAQAVFERRLTGAPVRRAAQADLDAAREEKMRALGYLR